MNWELTLTMKFKALVFFSPFRKYHQSYFRDTFLKIILVFYSKVMISEISD